MSYGLLYTARGIGSLAGALGIAALGAFAFRGKLLLAGAALYPLFMMLLAFTTNFPVSLILLFVVGAASILVVNLANAIIQTTTPDSLRGRVMGIYSLMFFGFMPLGALWTGTLASHIGEPGTVVVNSCLAFLCAGSVGILVPELRRE